MFIQKYTSFGNILTKLFEILITPHHPNKFFLYAIWGEGYISLRGRLTCSQFNLTIWNLDIVKYLETQFVCLSVHNMNEEFNIWLTWSLYEIGIWYVFFIILLIIYNLYNLPCPSYLLLCFNFFLKCALLLLKLLYIHIRMARKDLLVLCFFFVHFWKDT